jgi:hypothetical protein
MKSDKAKFQRILEIVRDKYAVRIHQIPSRKAKPNGTAHLAERTIHLYVKDKTRDYGWQGSVLIHEFGHLQYHQFRMNYIKYFIPTDFENEVNAWNYGQNYFQFFDLLPKRFEKIKEFCIESHRKRLKQPLDFGCPK